jgi:CxxC motif-containing protein (DUF1111 family)
VTGSWPWVALAGLGGFHGLNPAMGWLFAVALGLQRQRREAVLQALLPIAVGHALSISVVVLLVSALRTLIDLKLLELACATLLIGFGLYRLFARHRGRFGMQVSSAQLVLWSFLMATAHGAGLMLLPVLLGMPASHMHGMNAMGQSTTTAMAAIGIHTLAMLCVAGVVGIIVYEWLGLAFLRRGWINLDLVWVIALMGAGAILFVMALGGGDPTQVELGRSVFNTVWVAAGAGGAGRREGLGPVYNAASCATCHPGGARGAGPTGNGPAPVALEIELALPGETGTGDPVYGHVFNTAALGGAAAEGAVIIRYSEIYGYYYPDGVRWHIRAPHYELTRLSHGPLAPTTLIKPRLAPALFGVGLLEAVPGSVLGGGSSEVGRFGWQAEALSVRDQTTRAFAREMGLTSGDRPSDDCTVSEADCMPRATSGPAGGSPEVSDELLEAVVAFVHDVAVPASSAHPKNAELGAELFVTIGCAGCHRPRLGVIAPYTDLQLHDLGIEMDDENASGTRVASKWRTAPLWGLGYRMSTQAQPTFLHDGRARTPEEAILWHSGEAAPARRAFTNLGPRSRGALLHWLETL